MPPGDIVAQLQTFPAFAALSRPQLESIAALAHERHYLPDMFVLVEGEPVEAVYFIWNGFVKATRTATDGREQIISVLGPGDFFPHVGFLDGGPAPGTVHTLSPVTLNVIRRSDFIRLLHESSDAALAIIGVLEKRIRVLQNQLVDMGIKSVSARLAGLLLEMAAPHTPGAARDEEMTTAHAAVRLAGAASGAAVPAPRLVVNVHLSRQELAAMIGATRETVSRTLNDFRRAGVIDFKKDGSIVITSPQTLQNWANGP